PRPPAQEMAAQKRLAGVDIRGRIRPQVHAATSEDGEVQRQKRDREKNDREDARRIAWEASGSPGLRRSLVQGWSLLHGGLQPLRRGGFPPFRRTCPVSLGPYKFPERNAPP